MANNRFSRGGGGGGVPVLAKAKKALVNPCGEALRKFKPYFRNWYQNGTNHCFKTQPTVRGHRIAICGMSARHICNASVFFNRRVREEYECGRIELRHMRNALTMIKPVMNTEVDDGPGAASSSNNACRYRALLLEDYHLATLKASPNVHADPLDAAKEAHESVARAMDKAGVKNPDGQTDFIFGGGEMSSLSEGLSSSSSGGGGGSAVKAGRKSRTAGGGRGRRTSTGCVGRKRRSSCGGSKSSGNSPVERSHAGAGGGAPIPLPKIPSVVTWGGGANGDKRSAATKQSSSGWLLAAVSAMDIDDVRVETEQQHHHHHHQDLAVSTASSEDGMLSEFTDSDDDDDDDDFDVAGHRRARARARFLSPQRNPAKRKTTFLNPISALIHAPHGERENPFGSPLVLKPPVIGGGKGGGVVVENESLSAAASALFTLRADPTPPATLTSWMETRLNRPSSNPPCVSCLGSPARGNNSAVERSSSVSVGGCRGGSTAPSSPWRTSIMVPSPRRQCPARTSRILVPMQPL